MSATSVSLGVATLLTRRSDRKNTEAEDDASNINIIQKIAMIRTAAETDDGSLPGLFKESSTGNPYVLLRTRFAESANVTDA